MVPREESSVAFLIHEGHCSVLLKCSGKNGVFYKHRKSSDRDDNEMPLLWLPREYNLENSLKLTTESSVFGVVQKSSAVEGWFALRFESVGSSEIFPAAHSVQSNALFGRWKCSGTPVSLGIAGALTFLHQQGWEKPDILYVTEGHAIFIAENIGRHEPMHFKHDGVLRQIKWKAMNSKAKKLAKEDSQNRATASSVARSSSRLTQQLENRRLFLEKAVKVPPNTGARAAAFGLCFMIFPCTDRVFWVPFFEP